MWKNGRFLPVLAPGVCLLLGCIGGAHEANVRPGLNDRFKDPDLQVDEWVSRFEVESREIFRLRKEIAHAVGLRPRGAVADIGAGTGLFIQLFAEAVGPAGRVYAVDIAPRFLQHIKKQAEAAGLDQVVTVRCRDDSVDLPAESIDVAFICDTYHHFEYPRTYMRTIRRALRPGGQLILIDFDREGDAADDWVRKHVRAGQDQVTKEIQSDGFEFVSTEAVPGLKRNYFLRFQRPAG
ncbi:MAG: class I SAM-dependent methyltransferase [Phycisphaerae bacterium]